MGLEYNRCVQLRVELRNTMRVRYIWRTFSSVRLPQFKTTQAVLRPLKELFCPQHYSSLEKSPFVRQSPPHNSFPRIPSKFHFLMSFQTYVAGLRSSRFRDKSSFSLLSYAPLKTSPSTMFSQFACSCNKNTSLQNQRQEMCFFTQSVTKYNSTKHWENKYVLWW
jgi:hypothetical protein